MVHSFKENGLLKPNWEQYNMPDVLPKLKAYFPAGMLCLLLSLIILWQSTQDSVLLAISYTLILASALLYFTTQRQQIKCQITPVHVVLILWLLWICTPPLFGWVPLTSLFGIFQCSYGSLFFLSSINQKQTYGRCFFIACGYWE